MDSITNYEKKAWSILVHPIPPDFSTFARLFIHKMGQQT